MFHYQSKVHLKNALRCKEWLVVLVKANFCIEKFENVYNEIYGLFQNLVYFFFQFYIFMPVIVIVIILITKRPVRKVCLHIEKTVS